MNAPTERPPRELEQQLQPGGLSSSDNHSSGDNSAASPSNEISLTNENFMTLASLPVGARLVLRCRKDWRDATVAAVEPDKIVLSVASPSGHTYRVRRPHDSTLSLDGEIPVLGEGQRLTWRAGRARYDVRW